MPRQGTGPATDREIIDEWDQGFGWLAYPDEGMQRASHAFAVDGEVWVVDPVDVPDLDDLLAEYGAVAGVVLLLDRHKRDAGAIATRHGVSVHVPHWFDVDETDLDAPVERIRRDLSDTGYGVHEVVSNRFWQEVALYGEETGQLIVPEALGTASFYRIGDERVGVSPVLRLFPPKRLRRLDPSRLDVGHGRGIDDEPGEAIERAITRSRRTAPRAAASMIRDVVFG